MQLSIIIPVLNEEEHLGKLLHYLQGLELNSTYEILVVDGGSDDQTIQIAIGAGVRVLESPKGRARQMNYAARYARGNILYFLHADTLPPAGFDTAIINAVRNGTKAGCFRMKFDHSSRFLKFFSWFTRVNFQICRGGDQSLFIDKDLFESLGGYNESYLVYEDGEFFGRLYKRTGVTILPEEVVTSARKYEIRGAWALQFHFGMIHLQNFLGAGPEQLHAYYQRKISV